MEPSGGLLSPDGCVTSHFHRGPFPDKNDGARPCVLYLLKMVFYLKRHFKCPF